MSAYFLRIIVLLFSCCMLIADVSSQPNTSPKEDSITVEGKFVAPCTFPKQVKIWKYNPTDWNINSTEVAVGEDGTFSYKTTINGPQQISVKIDQMTFEFLSVPNEKVYQLQITCAGRYMKNVEILNSKENLAFNALMNFSKRFKDTLTVVSKAQTNTADNYPNLKKQFLTFQGQVMNVGRLHPQTFTAKVLCPAVLLPDSAFGSLTTLRANYFNRQILSNPLFYKTNILSSYLFEYYFSVLDDKSVPFSVFEKGLDIANRNPATARIFQQVLYYVFLARKQEHCLSGYLNWSNQNPGKILNPVVKTQLQNIGNCIAGAPFIDVALNDPSGKPRKLSELVPESKYTVLIFYSPTCAHCKEYLPKLMPVWNEYKSKGLRFYAVANDATPDEWSDFINNKVSPEWTHVFEYSGGSRPSSRYVITTTPTFVVIDQQGKIVTRFAGIEYMLNDLPKLFSRP